MISKKSAFLLFAVLAFACSASAGYLREQDASPPVDFVDAIGLADAVSSWDEDDQTESAQISEKMAITSDNKEAQSNNKAKVSNKFVADATSLAVGLSNFDEAKVVKSHVEEAPVHTDVSVSTLVSPVEAAPVHTDVLVSTPVNATTNQANATKSPITKTPVGITRTMKVVTASFGNDTATRSSVAHVTVTSPMTSISSPPSVLKTAPEAATVSLKVSPLPPANKTQHANAHTKTVKLKTKAMASRSSTKNTTLNSHRKKAKTSPSLKDAADSDQIKMHVVALNKSQANASRSGASHLENVAHLVGQFANNDKISIGNIVYAEGSNIQNVSGCNIAPKGSTSVTVCGCGVKVEANLLTECQAYGPSSQQVGHCDCSRPSSACDTRELQSGYTETFNWKAASFRVSAC